MDEDLDTTDTGSNDGPSLVDALSADLGIDGAGDDAGTDAGTGDAAAGAAAQPGAAGAKAPDAAAQAAAGQGGEAAADGTKPPAGAKPADPNAELYAPLPEHNPRRTHERFQKLVDGHKEEVTKREAAETERDTLRGQIAQYEEGLQPLRDMGFTDQAAVEDLQQFRAFRKALSSGDAAGALRIMTPILQQRQRATGGQFNLDPLSGFPDLAQRVNQGDIDQPTAIEPARRRHGHALQQQSHQRNQQAQQQHQQTMGEIHRGAQAVDRVVQGLMKDPDYKLVEAQLLPQLADIKKTYQPSQWAVVIQRTYDYQKLLLITQQAQHTNPAPPNT